MEKNTYLTLNNGLKMPQTGLGSMAMDEYVTTIYDAIKGGLRLIDTAAIYKNEEPVGQAINNAINDGIVKREDLFVVTKCWVTEKDDPESAIKESLKRLNLDYVDLYLDHWPIWIVDKPDGSKVKVPMHILWQNMESLVEKGYTKSIGMSNYNVQSILNILSICKIKPVVLQVEIQPYLPQKNLIEYCESENIKVMAYNSLGGGFYNALNKEQKHIMNEPQIIEIAKNRGVSTASICLSWATTRGLIIIPKSSSAERIISNVEVANLKLNEEEMAKIGELDAGLRLCSSVLFPFFNYKDIHA